MGLVRSKENSESNVEGIKNLSNGRECCWIENLRQKCPEFSVNYF